MPHQSNIIEQTKENTNFRKVLFPGAKSQLVVMDIKPGEEVGEEVHPNVEQTLYFLSGTGKAVLDDVESELKSGDVVVVTPGVKHNFVNTGEEPLKIYTTYSPSNHIEGRIHVTPADAEADVEDEEFGHNVK